MRSSLITKQTLFHLPKGNKLALHFSDYSEGGRNLPPACALDKMSLRQVCSRACEMRVGGGFRYCESRLKFELGSLW